MSVVKFEPGSWVWIEDEIERYLPAKVLKSFAPGEATTVETEDGEAYYVDPYGKSSWERPPGN